MFTALLAAAAITFTPADAQLAFNEAKAFVAENTPRPSGTIRSRLAAGWILDHVSRSGVDASQDKFTAPLLEGEAQFTNVEVEFPGTKTNASWIVVMSHFDSAVGIGGTFEGANDGASTTGLLIALAAAIRRAGTGGEPIALIWTDGEECRKAYGPRDGLQGSRHIVERFKALQRPIKCAICLDMLGDRNLNIIIPGNGEKALRRIALIAANRAGAGKYVSLADDLVVTDDHQPFLDAGYAAVNLIDFDYGSAPGKNDYWHTQQDTMDKVSVESLETAGKVVAELLTLLRK